MSRNLCVTAAVMAAMLTVAGTGRLGGTTSASASVRTPSPRPAMPVTIGGKVVRLDLKTQYLRRFGGFGLVRASSQQPSAENTRTSLARRQNSLL